MEAFRDPLTIGMLIFCLVLYIAIKERIRQKALERKEAEEGERLVDSAGSDVGDGKQVEPVKTSSAHQRQGRG